MDGFCPEPSEENNHKEPITRRRRSSILKPPRSPLQDKRSGNEIGQDITTRSRKSSRRVSFAETIKVFQTEIPTEVKEEPKNTGKAVGEKIPFKEIKRPEDNQCAIIGMETLLRAPIQAQLQQPEGLDMEPVHEKKYENDQTVIFSDENQMDLTASHTVMITKGLLSCPEMGKPFKIDTKSFLANLKSHTEDLTMNKDFNLSTAPESITDKCSFQSKTSTSSENKLNFNDFIKRLKLEKSISSCIEGPDKENVFIPHIPSQEPNNDAFFLPKKHVFPNAEEKSHGLARLFREQDDGKDITQCFTDSIQSMHPIAREPLLRPAERRDFTVHGNDFMDLTVNHTAQIFLPTNNVSGRENHNQSVTKGGYTTKNPETKRICKIQQNVPSQDPSGNLENEIDITRSHTGMIESHLASQASNQGSGTLTWAPESTCPGLVFQGDKTIFFSSNDDAMEMTKSLTPKRDDKYAHVSNLTQMYPNVGNANSSFMDKTVYSEEVDMDITKSNTVAIHDQIIELCPTNVQVLSLPNLENDLFQDQETVSEDMKQNKSCNTISYITRGRIQQVLANPLGVSLSGNNSVVFSGEDMDLTKCCTVKIDSSNLGTQLPLTSANVLAPVKTKKPLSPGSRPISQIVQQIPFPPKEAFNSFLQDKGDLQSEKPFGNCQNSLSQPENHTVANTDVSPEYAHQSLIAMKLVSTNSLLPYPSEKTIIFAPEQDNMDLTENHEVIIQTGNSKITAEEQQKQKYNEASLRHGKSPGLTLSSLNNKRMTENMGDSLEINKIHTIAGEKADLEEGTSSTPDKTVVFSDNQDDLEMTKSHTVVIDYQTMEKMQDRSHLKDSRRKSLGQPKMMFAPNDQTVVFSEEGGNDLDLTKSHTTVINSQMVPQGDGHRSIPVDRTIMFTSKDDMELTKSTPCMIDKTVEGPNLESAELLDKPGGRKSKNELYSNKTVVFPAGNENNMEVTSALTKEINHKGALEGEQDSCLIPLATASKTVLYRGEQDDMEITDITKSHFFAKDCEADLQDVGTSRKIDKTMVFADNQDELEITKSHTVVIDYQTMKKTQDRSNLKSSGRKSLGGPKMTFTPNDQTVFFSEEDGNDLDLTKSHTTVISSQMVPQGDGHRSIPMDKTVMFTSHDDMELTKSTPCMIDKTVEGSNLESAQLLDKPGGSKSKNELYSNKTVVFPAGNENNMEVASALTKEINHKGALEGEQDSCLIPLATSSKTVLYRGEQDDMEITDITKSHIFGTDYEADLQDVGTSRKIDKTMLFADNQDELEITKSHTVVIDYQTMKKTQDRSNLKSSGRKSLGGPKMTFTPSDQTVFFSEEDGNDLDLTKSHTTEISHKGILEGKQDSCLVPLAAASKTFLCRGKQDDMEITNFTESHMFAMDCDVNLQDLVTCQLMDKTVMFADNQDELEITKSHTVVIDYQTLEKTQDRSHLKDSRKNSQGQPKMMFAPNDQTVFFSEEDGNDLDLTKSHTTVINSQIVPQGDEHNNIPKNKTVMVTSSDDMELTKLTTRITDKTTEDPGLDTVQLFEKPEEKKSINKLNSDKTVVFSASDENEMEINNTCSIEINHKGLLEGGQDSCLVPLATVSKTVLYRGEQDDMEITDITKSHIFATDHEADLQDVGTNRRMDKTMVFSDNQDDLEITKSHTVVIDYQTMEKMQDRSHLKDSRRKSLGQPKMMFAPNDQTVIFSEEGGNDLDLTKSHTTVINSQMVPQGDGHRSIPVDRTIMFTSNDDMELTKSTPCMIDKTVEGSNLESAELLDKPGGSKSKNELYSNKTVVFPAGNENNMEVTSALTKEINHKGALEGEQDSCLIPLATVSKTVLYRGEQDDMEITDITKSHIFAKDCEADLQDVGTSRKIDKTMVFADNQDELEITKSHTVVIDYQTMKKTQDRSNLKSSGRKSLGGPKMTFTPNDQTVFFSEEDGNDLDLTKSHTTVINSQMVPQGNGHRSIPVDRTIMFTSNDDMELTKSTPCMIDKTVEGPNLESAELLDKPGGSKSKNELYSNKTVVFPAGNENNMEVTSALTKEINHKGALEGEQDSCLIPLATASKTVLYRGEQDDMEITDITKSHIFGTDCEADLQDVGTSRKIDKTMLFADNQDELEITKSHTVVIDHQTMKNTQNMFPDKAELDSFKRNYPVGAPVTYVPNNETIFLSGEGVNDKKVTKKQTDAIENRSFLQDVQQQSAVSFFPADKTVMFTGDQDAMEMDRSQSTIINEKPVEKVIDQDYILETAKNKASPFDSAILLGKMTKPKSKTIPFKFPKHQVKAFTNDGEQRQRSELFRDAVFADSQPQEITHLIPIPEKEQCIINKDKLMQPKAENGNLEGATGNVHTLNHENKIKMLHDDRELTTASEKELKQNVQISEWETTMEIHVNSGSITQVQPLQAMLSQLSNPVISSKAISTANTKPNLNNKIKRSEIFSQSQTGHIANFTEQLSKLRKQAEDSIDRSQTTEKQDTKIETNDANNIKDEGKSYSSNGDASHSVLKDKIKARRYSLGIFLPKLPNKRNRSVTGMNALEHDPVESTDLNILETQPVNKKNSNLMSALTEPHLSPSQYINEEPLPLDPEENNSSESISIETEGKTLPESCQKEIQLPESTGKETFTSQKRLLVQGEDDSVPSEKKIRKDETNLSNSAQALQALDHHIEENVDKNPCGSLMKSLNRTPSSCSSSSDSIKADGTSMNYSIQQSSQMESQFLMDNICEESLKEKLHDGRITVREFFTLLQVHILIQKPRQSNLPANFATNIPSTQRELMLSQYVYRPKIQIYKEDCQALREKTEELKLRALKQDKLLVDVNRSLWEVMKGCSDEELKTFGVHLNKMKSRFAKKTKVFAHQGKVVLYSKLVQSAKAEREKLQTRMDKMESVLKEVDTCLAALDLEIKNLDKNEEDIPMAEWDSEMLATEKELEQLQAKEEELKRNISELEIQRQQALAQINSLQREADRTKECLEKFNGSEWEIIEWSDSQAVFTFLYDSIELTITFGEPVDGLPFLSKTCRKIIDINFETLLHENKAPPSSQLVHRLIFQFIENQGSWKNKCITQHHVPKMLQEISLVVSRCRLLGEEIEFLNRWGPNYNLMNIDVNNTEVKLLFSSSAAFAKFELTLTLSSYYPSVPLSFTIQNLIGNIAQDKIAAVLSNVPLDNDHLKTAVRRISQDLLQGPRLHH
ncbi:kinetochore scaffold 1 [Dromiciops gliroides]|uniref:kinetochore scaffold 1 n=1 Tax=Dromiciops gliroides TaxID=33562 RepID=UPI001CC6FD95|nr:kinetochore scaffold 1 [Dromiciops gliroides]